jgi:8-oxo-dGTP diphosphatase
MKSDGKIQEQQEQAQPLQDIVVVAAIIVVDEHVLVTQRPANVHLPSVWEFPGGKVEAGESLQAALRRELREEIGIQAEIFDECFTTTHRYPEKVVELHFFNCAIIEGEPRAIEVADVRWVQLRELRSLEFPEADRELISRLSRPHSSF